MLFLYNYKMLIDIENLTNHEFNFIGNKIQKINLNSKFSQPGKLDLKKYQLLLTNNILFKYQQYQIIKSLYQIRSQLGFPDYYLVSDNNKRKIYVLRLKLNNTGFILSSLSCSEKKLINFLELNHEDNNTKYNVQDNKQYYIFFYCDLSGNIIRPSLYIKIQENIHTYKYYDLIKEFYDMDLINDYEKNNIHLVREIKPIYKFNLDYKLFFDNSIIINNLKNPTLFKQYNEQSSNVWIYQCMNRNKKENIGIIQKDDKHTITENKDIITYKNKDIELDIDPKLDIDVKVSNSNLSDYSMFGYKIAKSLITNKEVIIKIGIYPTSKVATSGNHRSKMRTNYCKVLKINNIIHIDDNNLTYGSELSRAKSSVWENDFIYTLNEDIIISNFGSNLNKVCKPGIHFYSNPELAIRNFSRYKHFRYFVDPNKKEKKPITKTTDDLPTSKPSEKEKESEALNASKKKKESNKSSEKEPVIINLPENISSNELNQEICDEFLNTNVNNSPQIRQFVGLRNRKFIIEENKKLELELKQRLQQNNGSHLSHTSQNIDALDLSNKITYYKRKLD